MVQRAITFFNALCTEPVRQIYLKQCINEYHPPTFKAVAESSRRKTGRSTRIVEAKLWFVGGLVFGGIPEKEKEQAEDAEDRARKLLKREKGTYVDQFRYPSKKRFMQHIRRSDWIVSCISEDKKKQVYPPEQILNLDSYPRGHGKRRYLIHTEACNNGEPMGLNMFRKKIRRIVPALGKDSPRTQPIENTDDADAILRLWTPMGRIARKH